MQSEQNYYKNQVINTDPREQSNRGYAPMPSPKRSYTGWIIVALLLVLLAGGGLFSVGFLTGRSSTLPERTFTVTGQSKLIVSDGSGSVYVHAGNTNTIAVRATKVMAGLVNNDLRVDYVQNGNTLSVSSRDGSSFQIGERSINFDISVPSTTDLAIDAGSGQVHIANIVGQIKASTGSGDIQASDITGQATLSTGSGNIIVDQAKLAGQTSAHTGSGNIRLTSSLDSRGSYRIDTGSGNISVSLPVDAAFQLEAKTESGTLHNDFGSNRVGTSPYATLSTETGSGDVQIRKQ